MQVFAIFLGKIHRHTFFFPFEVAFKTSLTSQKSVDIHKVGSFPLKSGKSSSFSLPDSSLLCQRGAWSGNVGSTCGKVFLVLLFSPFGCRLAQKIFLLSHLFQLEKTSSVGFSAEAAVDVSGVRETHRPEKTDNSVSVSSTSEFHNIHVHVHLRQLMLACPPVIALPS